MIAIKTKYIDRVANIVETEIDNIFGYDGKDCQFEIEKMDIIETTIKDLMFKIKQLEETE